MSARLPEQGDSAVVVKREVIRLEGIVETIRERRLQFTTMLAQIERQQVQAKRFDLANKRLQAPVGQHALAGRAEALVYHAEVRQQLVRGAIGRLRHASIQSCLRILQAVPDMRQLTPVRLVLGAFGSACRGTRHQHHIKAKRISKLLRRGCQAV